MTAHGWRALRLRCPERLGEEGRCAYSAVAVSDEAALNALTDHLTFAHRVEDAAEHEFFIDFEPANQWTALKHLR